MFARLHLKGSLSPLVVLTQMQINDEAFDKGTIRSMEILSEMDRHAACHSVVAPPHPCTRTQTNKHANSYHALRLCSSALAI